MKRETPRFRTLRVGALTFAVTFAAACGGGGDAPDESGATPQEVDTEASASVTDQEREAFTAPADSSLTPQQVEAFLKTALLQFDYVRTESQGFHDQAKRMEERGKQGGVIAGLRNAADAASFLARFGDVIGGSYVRSARTLKYNPAEMEYVRERMGEVGAYLAMKPMMDASIQAAQQMRTQVQTMRQQMTAGELQGYTETDLQNMEQQAAEMERNARESADQASRAAQRNLEVLHRARPNVTDKMWVGVTFSSGLQGWAALSGLANPQDTTAQRTLNEWRTVYTDALNNRVTAGMENDSTPATTPAS
jgi:hypothetical protein